MITALATLLIAAAPPPAAAPDATKPDDTKRFELAVGGLLQVRYDYDTDTEKHHLGLPRARFVLKGGYGSLVELNLGADFGDFGAKFVNAFANIRAYKKHLQLRAGRMKRPFLRERLVSAADLLLVDRSLLESTFGDKRDYGVMLHNGLDGKQGLEWAAGVFGDYDANDFLADEGRPEFNPVIAMRLGWYMKDLEAYEDADREGGGFRAGGAVSALVMADRAAAKGRETGYRVEADALFRWEGATLGGGFLARSDDVAVAAPSRVGGFVAADYFFAGQFDVAARWSTTKPDGGELDHEVALAFTSWLFADHLKLSVDGAWLGGTVEDGRNDYRVRLQLQVK